MAAAQYVAVPGLFWLLTYAIAAILAEVCPEANGTRVPAIARLVLGFSGPHRVDVAGLQLGLLGLSIGFGALTSLMRATHGELVSHLVLGQVVALVIAIWLSIKVTKAKLLGVSRGIYAAFGDRVPQVLERHHIRPWGLKWANLLALQCVVGGIGIGSTAVGMWIVVG